MKKYELGETRPEKFEDIDISQEYNVGDYLKWTLDGYVELIHGKVFNMSPAPATKHQAVSIRLESVFFHFFQGHPCHMFHAPFDVYLVPEGLEFEKGKNVVQPDICVICDKSRIKPLVA